MDFFSWSRFFNNLPKLLVTLPVTFEVVIVSYVFGIVFAILLACIRLKRVPVLNQLTIVFVSFERDTPLVVQMLISYYGIPILLSSLFGISTRGWPRIIYVFIAYIANVGAFMSEIFRAAIQAIPKGQREASLSCGLTEVQCFFKIILPQAINIALPNMWTFLVSLVKSTSYVFMIGVIDIIGRAKAIGTATAHSLESYIIVALVFIIISLLIQLPYHFVEKKLSFYNKPREEKDEL